MIKIKKIFSYKHFQLLCFLSIILSVFDYLFFNNYLILKFVISATIFSYANIIVLLTNAQFDIGLMTPKAFRSGLLMVGSFMPLPFISVNILQNYFNIIFPFLTLSCTFLILLLFTKTLNYRNSLFND